MTHRKGTLPRQKGPVHCLTWEASMRDNRRSMHRVLVSSVVVSLLAAAGVLTGAAFAPTPLHADSCEDNVCNMDTGNCAFKQGIKHNCDETEETLFDGCDSSPC